MYGLIAIIIVLVIILILRQSEPFINKQRTITYHYTNWCGACKLMRPVWDRVRASTHIVGSNEPRYIENDEDVKKTPGVIHYPTILMVDTDGKKYEYKGGADYTRLSNWANAIRPVS